MDVAQEPRMASLAERLREVSDLHSAAAVLHWDQMTYMPAGGAGARGRQIAVLERLAHEKATDPALGSLLGDVAPYAARLPYDADDAALVRVARRDYDRATRIPSEFTAELAEHQAAAYDVWTRARAENNFDMVRGCLEQTLELSLRYSDFFPGCEHPADPLIDESDFGMKASTVRSLFDQLQARLTPLVQTIADKPPVDNSVLHRRYPIASQIAFGESVIADFGFDFARGRQDTTVHPFATRFCWGDVRITTRYDEEDLAGGLFSTLHESGHAMYEQGIDWNYCGSPLGHGTSSGVHESQSRTWENLVGRSRIFWQHYYPGLRAAFPDVLDDVDIEAFYRAVNKVERSFIRTEADEVTYNLHVIIRFGLELDMLEGRLAIRDLPEAWNARYQEVLGVTPPTDTLGVLQDVHWYGGLIGGQFQGYTLGNIMSGQFWEAALEAHPEILDEIGHGRFQTLHTWLRENIYQHGSKFTAEELVQRITGGAITIEPYMRYLTRKYGDIYGL